MKYIFRKNPGHDEQWTAETSQCLNKDTKNFFDQNKNSQIYRTSINGEIEQKKEIVIPVAHVNLYFCITWKICMKGHLFYDHGIISYVMPQCII